MSCTYNIYPSSLHGVDISLELGPPLRTFQDKHWLNQRLKLTRASFTRWCCSLHLHLPAREKIFYQISSLHSCHQQSTRSPHTRKLNLQIIIVKDDKLGGMNLKPTWWTFCPNWRDRDCDSCCLTPKPYLMVLSWMVAWWLRVSCHKEICLVYLNTRSLQQLPGINLISKQGFS